MDVLTTRRADCAIEAVASALLDDVDDMTAELVRRICTEDPYFAKVGAAMEPEVHRSVREQLVALLHALAAVGPFDPERTRELARRRADHGVPVAALLNAHRLGAQVVWERCLRAAHTGARPRLEVDEVVALSREVWALFDAASRVISDSYEDTIVERARRSDRRRALLLDALIDGRDVSIVAEAARILELPLRGPLVVVVAEAASPVADPLPDVDRSLRAHGLHSVWRQQGHRKVGVVVLRAATAPRTATADAVAAVRDIVGARLAGRAGVSPAYGRLIHTACSVRLGMVAMACVPADASDVAAFDERPLDVLVAGSPQLARHTTRIVFDKVLALPDAEQRVLLATLDAWIDEGGSATRAAERVLCHRNTVHNRLHRIEELTRRSLTDPTHLAEICIAAKAHALQSARQRP